jgi:hypothetical protein
MLDGLMVLCYNMHKKIMGMNLKGLWNDGQD